jgi:hypothetical protein
MKPHPLIFPALLASLIGVAEAHAEDAAIPQGYKVERYAALWERSPFTTASASDGPAEPAAAKLVLAGVAKIGNEDIVTLLNKDSQERTLVTQTPNAQGYKLVSVEQNSDPLKVVATLLKGTESLKVRFDPALLSAPSKSPQNPGQNPQQSGNLMPMPMPPQAMPATGQVIERQVRRPPIPLPVIPNRAPVTPPKP